VPAATLPSLDLAALADATAPWEEGLAARTPPAEPAPRLAIRE
jgi:hypothetical protein